MLSKQWLAVAACAFLPLAASAQQTQSGTSPLDPKAPASAVRYESAFENYRSSQEDGESPDQVWRTVNEEMGKLGGHAGHIKDDGAESSTPPGDKNTDTQEKSAVDHSKHH